MRRKKGTKLLFATSMTLLLALLLFSSPKAISLEQASAAEMTEAPAQPVPEFLAEAGEQEVATAENSLLHGLQVKVKVTNQGEAPSRNITLQIPLLAQLDSPYQALVDEQFSHQPVELNGGEMGSRRMTVELPVLEPGESEVIVMDYALASGVGSDGAALLEGNLANNTEDFLQPSSKVESDHPDIEAKAQELTKGLRSDREKAEEIYAFVIDHMSYDSSSPYRNKGALYGLRYGEGVCEEYASLFTALCRAAGIPARVVNGYTDPAGTGEAFRLASGESLSLKGYRHAWVEFYIEGEGWLPADPTFEHSSSAFNYFGSFPHQDRIAQNYLDLSIQGRFRGGQLAVSWDEALVGH